MDCKIQRMENIKTNYYVIEESVLATLLRKSFKLECLAAWGVHNMDNYYNAMEDKTLRDDGIDYYEYSAKTDYEISKLYLLDNPSVVFTLEDYKDWTS